MSVSEFETVSEAKGLVRLFVLRQRRNGLNVDQAIHREANKCGVPQSEIKSLWYRVRQTVSAAVMDNLRDRYEVIHNAARRAERAELLICKLTEQELDPDLGKPLKAEIRKAESTHSPDDQE